LISLRRESVGEASGPVVMAHLAGTPVAGLAVGSLREYCGPGDIILPESTTATELLRAIVRQRPLPRIVPDGPQVTRVVDAAQSYAKIYAELGWISC
jgi:hypothetical protein